MPTQGPLQPLIERWKEELANTLTQSTVDPLDSATFGAAMRLAAMLLGTQEELAKRIGHGRADISRWCNGKVHRNKSYAKHLIITKLPEVLRQ